MVGDSVPKPPVLVYCFLLCIFCAPIGCPRPLFVAEKLVPGGHRCPLNTVFAEFSEKETAVELNDMSCTRSFQVLFCSEIYFIIGWLATSWELWFGDLVTI